MHYLLNGIRQNSDPNTRSSQSFVPEKKIGPHIQSTASFQKDSDHIELRRDSLETLLLNVEKADSRLCFTLTTYRTTLRMKRRKRVSLSKDGEMKVENLPASGFQVANYILRSVLAATVHNKQCTKRQIVYNNSKISPAADCLYAFRCSSNDECFCPKYTK